MIEKLPSDQENDPPTAHLKNMDCQEMKGKAQPPHRQKTDCSNFQPGEGQAYRDQTAPKPNQNHSPEKATPKGNKPPIFGVIGKGFTFASTTGQQDLFQAWLKGQQVKNSTPGKAFFVVQKMLNENSGPPSIQGLINDFLYIITPQIKIPPTTSRGMLSQKPNNTDTASPELFLQISNTSNT